MNDEHLNTAQPQSALLLSATLYLLSQAALNTPCLGRARMVIEHLEMLASDSAIDPALRATALQLRSHWITLLTGLTERNTHAAEVVSGTPLPQGFLH